MASIATRLVDPHHTYGVDAARLGTVLNNAQVVVKPDAKTAESPLPGARVRLHRAIDGICEWQGVSDAQGNYAARGLTRGLDYLPVAIDTSKNHKAAAAGPVTAEHYAPEFAPVEIDIGVPYERELRLRNLLPGDVITRGVGNLPAGVTDDGLFLHAEHPAGTPGAYVATYTVERYHRKFSVTAPIILRVPPLDIAAQAPVPTGMGIGIAIAPITFVASGGVPPYTFAVADDLPTGLQLQDGGDGHAVLSGTPNTSGEYAFGVLVIDARRATARRDYAMRVGALISWAAYTIALVQFVDNLGALIVNDATGQAWNREWLLYAGQAAGVADYMTCGGTAGLRSAKNLALPDANGDYTVACWLRPTSSDLSVGSVAIMIGSYNRGASSGFPASIRIGFYQNKIDVLFWNAAGQVPTGQRGKGTASAGVWYHIEVCISGGTTARTFVNGVLAVTESISGGVSQAPAPTYIGPGRDAAVDINNLSFRGDVREVLVLKGIALHNSNFTPPAAPYSMIV